jgi:putative ABC transport system substrate-binding protein
MIQRREFITLLGGAAVVWPSAGRAQQSGLPLIGVLRSNPKNVNEVFAEPFRRYMKAAGWEDGRNIRFLFVWAEGHSERAPALAGELVAQNVDLIITFGDPAIRAAQARPRASQSSAWPTTWSAVVSRPACRDRAVIPPG